MGVSRSSSPRRLNVPLALLASAAVMLPLTAGPAQADPQPAKPPENVPATASSDWAEVRVEGGVVMFRLAAVPSRLVKGTNRGQVFRIETRAIGRPSPVASNTILEFQRTPGDEWSSYKPILAMRKIVINGRDYTGVFPASKCNALGSSKTTQCGVVGPDIDRKQQRRNVTLSLMGMTTDNPLTNTTFKGAVRVTIKPYGNSRAVSTEWVPVSYVIGSW